MYNFKKFSWRERAPVPLADACYARPNIERRKVSREKNFAIRKSFPAKIWGAWRPLEQQKRGNPRKFSPRKSYFSPICESFLPRKFPALAHPGYATETSQCFYSLHKKARMKA